MIRMITGGVAVLLSGSFAIGAPPRAAVQVSRTSSEIGLEYVSLHYREPGVMTESGNLFGVCGSFTMEERKTLIRVSGSVAAGTITYDGGCDDDYGNQFNVSTDTDDTLLYLKGIVGWRMGASAEGDFTGYLGLGLRFLVDDLPAQAGECMGYRREQTYVYLPLGVEAVFRTQSNWRWGLRAEGDVLLVGNNNSGGVTLTQNSGFGAELSVFAVREAVRRGGVSFSLEPFVRYWDVSQSAVTSDGWYEPANNCTEVGIKASLVF